MELLEVLSPIGIDVVARAAPARRLESLEGRTVCEIWNGVFKGDVSFPIVRALLQRKFAGLKIVPYTEFPHAPGSDHPARQREAALQMAALAREKGCDAVISGNGA